MDYSQMLQTVMQQNGFNIKTAVYPYGKRGRELVDSFRALYGKEPDYIVDNYLEQAGIYRYDDVNGKQDVFWFITIKQLTLYAIIKDQLILDGVDERHIIDVCGNERQIEDTRILAEDRQKHYAEVVDTIRKKKGGKLRFGVYAMYDETFGASALIKQMALSDRWDYRIVCIPDVLRKEEMLSRYHKTRDSLVEKWGKERVYNGYDEQTDEYIDWSKEFDIIYCCNPYDPMAHRLHSIEYLSTQDVLPIYINYGFDCLRETTYSRYLCKELNLVWKCFADTVFSYEDYIRVQPLRGKNVFLSGYAKMDDLVSIPETKHDRLKILISPHHTVQYEQAPLSNFLRLYKEILLLPDLYPEIDFVFRPHPLLFPTLRSCGLWDDERIDQYLSDLARKGVVYSPEGDYLHLFRECDAIIHDCGSYTVEWLFTGKPACFVRNPVLKDSQLTRLMLEAMKQHCIAKDFDDIRMFINELLVSPDRKRQISKSFLDGIMINYPNVSAYVAREIDLLNDPAYCE